MVDITMEKIFSEKLSPGNSKRTLEASGDQCGQLEVPQSDCVETALWSILPHVRAKKTLLFEEITYDELDCIGRGKNYLSDLLIRNFIDDSGQKYDNSHQSLLSRYT